MLQRLLAVALCVFCSLFAVPVFPCTNFLVTKGASADGSTMISYAADSHELYGELYYLPASKNAPGAKRQVYEWDTGKYLGEIAEAPETYSVVGNMNEYQVSIGETTFGGREELLDPKALIDYGSLMYIALQRAKTAREAISIMGSLVNEYGYYSSGESFSIADPDEVWMMGMIGKGPEEKGAVWVAMKIPDGYVSAHANNLRILDFPRNSPDVVYSPDVVSFARKKGYFSGDDKDFSFADAYAPLTWQDARVCEARVWSFYRLVAPSRTFDVDFVRGGPDKVRVPLWIKPDRKLTVQDVQRGMRDHFEGTELDLTKGIGAGPFECPYRWRPLMWEMDGAEYLNERSTATQQTGFSFVAQARSWLPDPIGGILWFGVDDAASTVYVPMYCGIMSAPYNYAVGTGNFHAFTWDSAFWVFNWVANQAYARYNNIIKDIQVVQQRLEGGFQAQIPEIDKAALALYKQSPLMACEYLTKYSHEQASVTVLMWRKLGESILVKYLDGNVRNEKGEVTHPRYPDKWYENIIKESGELFKVRLFPREIEEKEKKKREEEEKKAACPCAVPQ